MSWKWKTASPEETWKLAQRLGTLLRGKEVLCLSGDLGAGKTLFSQGLASGLGVAEDVTSPTFTLMNVYQSGKGEMYHFDLYRLEDASQLWDIDFYTYVEGRGIALIEWPDAFGRKCLLSICAFICAVARRRMNESLNWSPMARAIKDCVRS